MRVTVTGGAGYIGAHIVSALLEDDHDVAVVDDLSSGERQRVPASAQFFVGSILDTNFLVETFHKHGTEAVVHVAAKKSVEESVADPLLYYDHNVVGTHRVLSAMATSGVNRIVFSSSAAVYGVPAEGLVTEESETSPASPYGWSKLMAEQLLRDGAAAHRFEWVSLRYFNVAGATHRRLADRGVNNLIPRVFRALTSGESPQIFGDCYPTPDGTCIRDYIHVEDVADAHVNVLRRMATADLATTYNIGTGTGTSVRDVMLAVRAATGIDFTWEIRPPRVGDPAQVVAVPAKIREELGWTCQHDLESIVSSAWNAWSG